MPSFQQVYEAAIVQDTAAIKRFLSEDADSLNVRQDETSNLTVAEVLAGDNRVDAVNFLRGHNRDINIIDIALAYVRGGFDDSAEQCLLEDEENDQLAHDLVSEYARAGNDERVLHYKERHRVNPDVVIKGYFAGGHYEKAQDHFKLITDTEEYNFARKELAWSFAKAGLELWAEHFVTEHGELRETLINGYVAGGHDTIVEELLRQSDNNSDYVEEALWRYAFDGKHDKVEEFLGRFPNINRKVVVSGYSQGGHDDYATFYRDQQTELEADNEVGGTLYMPLSASRERLSPSFEEAVSEESDGEELDASGSGVDSLFSSPRRHSNADGDQSSASLLQNSLRRRSVQTHTDGEEEDNHNEEQASGVANHDAGEIRANNNDAAAGSNNGNAQPGNNQSWHGIDMHVLSLFVAGVGATAVAAAIVALALHAITLPVCLTIATVGVVATGLGGFGFFKYAPQAPAASAAENVIEEQQQFVASA